VPDLDIDILCAVGTNGSKYAEYFRTTALSLSTSDYKINWKCMMAVDRGSKYEEPKGFTVLGSGENKVDHGSINHTATMHELLKKSNSDITIIADVDLAILKMGWDVDVIKYLKEYDCFGIGWGSWDRKYMDFPSIMFIAFHTKLIRELSWDLSPVSKKKNEGIERYAASSVDSKICSVPIGTVLKKDSGWRIPYFFKKSGKTGFSVEKVKVGSKGSQLPFKNKKQKALCLKKPTHMSEYILNGELWASHLQASRSKPFNKENASTWRWRCNEFINKKYGI